MDRRIFIKSTSLLGSGIFFNPLSSCTIDTGSGDQLQNAGFDPDEVTIDELRMKMEREELTAEVLTQTYLERIKKNDSGGPELKSVIEINPEALSIARQLDKERQNGKTRGALHGIPILIKDNIDTSDKMQTTAGSLAMKGFYAPEDAFIVKKIREAGLVLLGKTNLSEWANFRSTRSSSGWSARGGQVKNPYDTTRNPCGSSSGSAVAVAANLCTLSIGTETNGSIVCPSGINGIVGIKPSLGRCSRTGIIPIAHSQDTAGPMARTVKDAARLLQVMQGMDPEDPATLKVPEELEYVNYDENSLKGKRVGVIRDFMGFHTEVDALFEDSIKDMKSAGAEIIDINCGDRRNEWNSASYQVLLYEFKADLNDYLSRRKSTPVNNLKEIIEFNETYAEKEMPWFGQEIFLQSVKKGDLDSDEYKKALEQSKRLSREAVDTPMRKYDLNVLIAPTNAPAWKTDLVNGDHFVGGSSGLAAISGYPSITVPCGFVQGLPIGISFIGKLWGDTELISIAYSYEQHTKHRKKPFI